MIQNVWGTVSRGIIDAGTQILIAQCVHVEGHRIKLSCAQKHAQIALIVHIG